MSPGDKVYVNYALESNVDVWMAAEVQSVLSVQFTAMVTDGSNTLCFRFFNDKGDTWREYDA